MPKERTLVRLFGVLDAPQYTPSDDDIPATLTFQLIVSAPTDPRLPCGSAVLPCLVPGPSLREEAIADCFPAGAAVEVTGFLDHDGASLWFVVTMLDNPETEPLTPVTVDDVDVRSLHGYTIIRATQTGEEPPWWSIVATDGTLIGQTTREDLVPVLVEEHRTEPTSRAELRNARRTELQGHRRRCDQRRPIR